jgi:predicted nuclease of restriction endonuclease-like (RecB) superfamily
LTDTYSEKDLETSIIVELQHFIIEMGSDFAFMARQKRISIDDRDYYTAADQVCEFSVMEHAQYH